MFWFFFSFPFRDLDTATDLVLHYICTRLSQAFTVTDLVDGIAAAAAGGGCAGGTGVDGGGDDARHVEEH